LRADPETRCLHLKEKTMTDQMHTKAGCGKPQGSTETEEWLMRLLAAKRELIDELHRRDLEWLGEHVDQRCERMRKLGGRE
jgi:hypothetical protein